MSCRHSRLVRLTVGCRRLIPTGDGDVLGEGFEDTDWYYEHIAGASRKEVAEFDRKVWVAMKAAGIRK